tara:strand:+ start:9025 stop:15150 length:6126 start_codon:yes stop_codon:yes gene_type:complete
MAITEEQYREIVKNIPDKDVQSVINTSDATNGLGNAYSMYTLNQYFNNQLPTQKNAEAIRQSRDPEDTTPVTEPDSTAPISRSNVKPDDVGRRFGANPLEASRKADAAYEQKIQDFLRQVAYDDDMSAAQKREYAERNAIRYVRNWYNMPRTASGNVMPMATVTGLQGVLQKQGLSAVAQALKPRTYKKSEAIAALQAQGETDPAAARKARQLLSEYFTGAEDEARRLEIRPQIRVSAIKEVKEQWDDVVREYLTDQGYSYDSGTFTTEFGLAFKAPKNWEELLEMRKEPSMSEVDLLGGLQDYFNSKVDKAEDRIVQKRRQQESFSFYREAIDLVRGFYEREGISLPDISPGKEGSEQRADFDSFPKEVRDNYYEMRTTALKLGREKAQEHDFVVYREYLEDELGTSQEESRLGLRLPFTDKTWRIDYKPDQMRTRLLGGTKDFLKGAVYTENELGDVAETFVGAGFRDLGGLIRFGTSPIFKLFSYDVDENGNPLNTDDLNYRFDQWTERALERMAHDSPGRSVGSSLQYVVDQLGTGFAAVVPSRMAKTVSTGRRGRMNTGSYFKDVAVEIYNNRFLADDFNELVATRNYWEQKGMSWVPGAAGLGVEVALPLTPYPMVKTAIASSGRILQEVERSLQGARLSDFINSLAPRGPIGGWSGGRGAPSNQPEVGRLGRVGRVMENPRLEAEIAILASVGRNIVRTARGVDEIGDVANVIAQEARLPRQLAVRLAGEIIELFDFSKDAAAFIKSLEKIREMHWGKNNTDIANIIEDLAGASERLRKARKTNSLDDLKKDPQGLALIDEIGAQSSIGIKFADPAFERGVLHGYLSDRITRELVNYVPNRYVMATGNVIVPMSKWKKNRKAIQKEIGERLKLDEKAIEADAGYIYENAKDASDLLISAYGKAKVNNTPFLMDIYKKLKNGKPLTLDEFATIDQILRGSIVKSKITGSYRLTHTGAASERATEAATGRQKTLPRIVEDFRRAVNLKERMFAYMEKNPTPPPAKLTPKDMVEGLEISKLKPWREITDGYAGIDSALRKEILAARVEEGDAWLGMSAVMQRYGSDNPIDDIMSILFSSPGKMTGGFFGDTAAVRGITWDKAKAGLEKHLKKMARQYDPAMAQFTPGALVESIDFMRKTYPGLAKRSSSFKFGKSQPVGQGKRVYPWTGKNLGSFLREEGRGDDLRYRRIRPNDSLAKRQADIEHNAAVDRKLASFTDYADAQIFAFLVDAKKSEIVKKASEKFARIYPELTIPVSRPNSLNEKMFRESLVDALTSASKAADDAGLSIKDPTDIAILVDDIVKKSAGWLFRGETNLVGGVNAADMRYTMNAIIKDVYDNGAMTTLSQQRIADVFYTRAGVSKDVGVVAVSSRAAKVKEVVTKSIIRHLNKTKKQFAPEQVDELATLISGRIMSDFIESTTGQTIDTLMGNLSSVGLPVRIDNSAMNLPELQSALVQLGDDYVLLMPNRTADMVDGQQLLLLEELVKSSAKGDLQRNLSSLRERDERLYTFGINNISGFYNLTKRATIGGLLGGFGPFAALRFHGLNVMTAPLIIAITMPKFALQSIQNIPGAALSFTKPVAEAVGPTISKAKGAIGGKVPGAQSSFNWMSNKLSNDPNQIMFVDKWGSPWTRARYQNAVRTNNIRYSQVTYEFRDTMINELRRTAALMPNLTKSSFGRQILRWFNPANKSLWTRWAEEADMAFREGVFAAALKEGAGVDVAARLARNALLDYGAISKEERNLLTKGMLFYAFKRQMMIEVASAFVRGGDHMKALRAQMAFTMNQKQMMDTWVYDENWQKTRLYSRAAENFDGVKNYLYGVEAPGIGALADLVNLAGATIDTGMFLTTDQATTYYSPGDVFKAAEDTFLAHPLFQGAIDIIGVDKSKGSALEPQGLFRPEWVYFFQNTGTWSIAQKFFGLEPVPMNKRRPNEYLQMISPDGRAMRTQWRIEGKQERNNWIAFYALSTVAGANRVIRDWSLNAIMGDESGDISWKKRGEGNRMLQLFGLETPGSIEGIPGIVYTQAGQIVKSMNSMKKE